MAYEVPPLPYDYDALAPTIDEQTMHLHHDKHHQAYVTAANGLLEGTEWADKPVDEVLKNLDKLPSEKQAGVRNQAGGHSNHSKFWEWMSPNGGGEPDGDLRAAIDAAFGSFDDFKARDSRCSPRRTRTARSRTARPRCSATTSGSTPTT
jgi:Fe-Mn family superoxide dismutase